MTAATTEAQQAGVHTSVRSGVGTVVISNPARRNAVSVSMMRDLATALAELDRDPSIRVVVLRGAGEDAFVSGADISEFREQTEQTRQLADSAAAQVFESLAAVSVPVIARIHGYCLGAGVALALGADLRCGDTRGLFAIPASRLGVGYPLAQTAALIQTVGPAAAGDLLYTGRRLPADEALGMGLLDRVVEPERLGEVVDELAGTIAANAPLSVRAAKAAIRAVRQASEGAPTAEGARQDALDKIARCQISSDLQEGATAFMEKRPPRFTGH